MVITSVPSSKRTHAMSDADHGSRSPIVQTCDGACGVRHCFTLGFAKPQYNQSTCSVCQCPCCRATNKGNQPGNSRVKSRKQPSGYPVCWQCEELEGFLLACLQRPQGFDVYSWQAETKHRTNVRSAFGCVEKPSSTIPQTEGPQIKGMPNVAKYIQVYQSD